MDTAGTKWVGGIQGGIDGLRAQLVHTLESTGLGLTSALESAGNSLWVTLESRRLDVDAGGKPNDMGSTSA
jgi:large subunit ribosomal protein L10